MDIRGKLHFLRQNLFIYIMGVLLILGMKHLYSRADCDSLRWILGPTARWVEALSGIPFTYEPGMGYVNHGLRYLIAPSCSGVQFMIITAAMLIFSFSHLWVGGRHLAGLRLGRLPWMGFRHLTGLWRWMRCHRLTELRPRTELPWPGLRLAESRHPKAPLSENPGGDGSPPESAGSPGSTGPSGARAAASGRNAAAPAPDSQRPRAILRILPGLAWIAISLLLSYGFTIFVNGLRIVAAIYLPYFFKRSGVSGGWLTPDRLHTMIGAVVYFASLLTIHRLAGLLFDRFPGTGKDRPSTPVLGKCLAPLFWYFFIVLGIPFLNRASRRGNGQFAEFALLVALCCGTVLLLYGLGLLVRRKIQYKEKDC